MSYITNDTNTAFVGFSDSKENSSLILQVMFQVRLAIIVITILA